MPDPSFYPYPRPPAGRVWPCKDGIAQARAMLYIRHRVPR